MSAAPRLDRVHLTIGRASEYFTANELEKQTGQPRRASRRWRSKSSPTTPSMPPRRPACHRTSPSTCSAMPSTSPQRGDNGPGMSADVLERMLDFETRTSDKARLSRADPRAARQRRQDHHRPTDGPRRRCPARHRVRRSPSRDPCPCRPAGSGRGRARGQRTPNTDWHDDNARDPQDRAGSRRDPVGASVCHPQPPRQRFGKKSRV